jgi:hypothetical protein
MKSTAERTIEIWGDSIERSHCRGCHAAIAWATIVATGRRMCFNSIRTLGDKTAENGRPIRIVDLTLNHWANCPDAARFRRRNDYR